MITNMQLEDVLGILGRVGTVTLRKGTNDSSGTPGHKANVDGWTCEITLRGYLRPFGHGFSGSILRLTSEGAGLSALDAAKSLLDRLEAFLDGEDGARCRNCYLKDHEVLGKGRELDPELKIEWNL